MKVLGSTYLPIMQRLAEKISETAELRAFDETVPFADQLGDIDVLMLGHQKVTAADLDRAPRLRLIHQHGRGTDSLDLAAATERGIVVANVPGGNSVAVAEHCLALMLFQAKQLGLTEAFIERRIVGAPSGLEIKGKSLLIVGLGAAGSELARMARALGMRVLATKRRPDPAQAVDVDVLRGSGELHSLLPEGDFVVVLAALTNETRGLIGAQELNLMKPTAFLVNAGRGALVDYDALREALEMERIAGAAFDTFWAEPADPKDPILGMSGFLLTPHVAGFSDEAIEHVTGIIAQNISSLSTNGPILNVVNEGT
ncbi:2-hydroxyacid dehydrogenase family protein [Octadecabacter arcticus 238]|uniref:2-hydroxyacid dehydrogenase family protein n=1 Tax=Octadecabacter arcticus 238 TaxID=391616 RepID=M9RFY9_9RHOB|nr:NAD(P)-dependent oxidoreductase [Octadecabacter arcticus]AGI71489.1 2-hydroxyacid dehydrogenase family protein [Octadecabacter arcticus 238]